MDPYVAIKPKMNTIHKSREASNPLQVEHDRACSKLRRLEGLRSQVFDSLSQHVEAYNALGFARQDVVQYPGVGTHKGGKLLFALAEAVEAGRSLLGESAPKDTVRLRLPSQLRAEIEAQYAEAERLAQAISERDAKHRAKVKELDQIIFEAGIQRGGESMEALFEPQSAKIEAIAKKKAVVSSYKSSMRSLTSQFEGAKRKAVSMWLNAVKDHQKSCRAALLAIATEIMTLLKSESDDLTKGYHSFSSQVGKAKAAKDIAYETLRRHNIRKESEEDSLAHELLRDAAAAGRKDKRVIKAEQFLRKSQARKSQTWKARR